MSKYEIYPYTYKEAKKMGVDVKPSKYANKKIDVYNLKGDYLVSVGDIRYKDYPTYLATSVKEYAEERRRLYKIRHSKDRLKEGTAGYYADRLLW